MSDGGAGAAVEAVSLLSKSGPGRVLLVLIAGFLGIQYLSASPRAAPVLGVVALGLVLAAVLGHFLALRRKRETSASLWQLLAFAGLLALAFTTAIFLWLGRRRAPAPLAVPGAAELDARLRAQGWGGPSR